MRSRRSKMILGAVLGLGVLGFLAAPAAADHFSKLSNKHTLFGYSQFNYGNIGIGRSNPIKWVNPNHVTQLSAALIYESDRPNRDPVAGTRGLFRGCIVRQVKQHDSQGASNTEVRTAAGIATDGTEDRPLYVEMIWARDKKTDVGGGIKRRLADGLGGDMGGTGGEESKLTHPDLFTLPRDAVVPGQAQDAIDCVCAEVAILGAGRNVFQPFGISCPAPP